MQLPRRKTLTRLAAAALLGLVGVGAMFWAARTLQRDARLGKALEAADHEMHHGSASRAEKTLLDALRESPGALSARDMLANIYALEHRKKDAYEQWRLGVKYNPRDAEAHYCLGMAYWIDKRYRDAIGVLEQARSVGRDHVTARNLLARCYWRGGQIEKAAAEFSSILADYPGNPGAMAGIRALKREMSRKKAPARQRED